MVRLPLPLALKPAAEEKSEGASSGAAESRCESRCAIPSYAGGGGQKQKKSKNICGYNGRVRWVQAKAEALLHLRCIELNGDWHTFATWFQRRLQRRLGKGERCKVLTDQPLPLTKAA